MNLAERWLRNAWALTWGLVVLSVALLVFAFVDSAWSLQVISIATVGFNGLRTVETFKGTTS